MGIYVLDFVFYRSFQLSYPWRHAGRCEIQLHLTSSDLLLKMLAFFSLMFVCYTKIVLGLYIKELSQRSIPERRGYADANSHLVMS